MSYNNHHDRGGGGGGAREHRGFRGTAENAKTVLCTRFTSPEGCRFGDRCNFAHGDLELQPRKPRSHNGGQSGYGPSFPEANGNVCAARRGAAAVS